MAKGIIALATVLAAGWIGVASDSPVLVDVKKIWDRGEHNAFTDLIWSKGQFLCVFREGRGHVSPDGKARVIASKDGQNWQAWSEVTDPNADLRDPKICETPDGKLMLVAAAARDKNGRKEHQTYAWFSKDGLEWGERTAIGDVNFWLWRVSWRGDIAYSVGYETTGEKIIRLYRSSTGRDFTPLVENLLGREYPNETSLVFGPDGGAWCLLRRDGQPGSGLLGLANPPYTNWVWKDLKVKIGGPHMVRLPDGRLIAAVRLYDGQVRTSLAWLDPKEGKLQECLKLPSGGDTSYAGLVWRENFLWVSYYSSHEGKTSIYLARARLSPAAQSSP